MTKPISPPKTAQKSSHSLGSCILGSLFAGIVLCVLSLLFFSWVFSKADLPLYAAVPMATAAICIGTAGAAMLLSRLQQKNGLLLGLCTGVFFFAAYALAALLGGQREFTGFAAIKLASILLSGCLGGYLGLLCAEQKKRRRPGTMR